MGGPANADTASNPDNKPRERALFHDEHTPFRRVITRIRARWIVLPDLCGKVGNLGRTCRRDCLLKADREQVALLVKPGATRVEAGERAGQDLAVSKTSDLNEQLVASVIDADLAAGCEWHRHGQSIAMRRRQ